MQCYNLTTENVFGTSNIKWNTKFSFKNILLIYIILIMISYWPWYLTPACSGSFAILAAAHRLNEPNSEPNQLLSASYSLALHRNECYSFESDVFVCKHHIPELLSSAARGVLCCLVCYQASRGLRVNLQSDLFIHCKWDGDRETARDSSKRSKQIEFRNGKNIDCCTGNPSFFLFFLNKDPTQDIFKAFRQNQTSQRNTEYCSKTKTSGAQTISQWIKNRININWQ